MSTEQITWHDITEQMPDTYETVLIRTADGETWPVWNDGPYGWRNAEGFTQPGITHWATMPKGPTP